MNLTDGVKLSPQLCITTRQTILKLTAQESYSGMRYILTCFLTTEILTTAGLRN